MLPNFSYDSKEVAEAFRVMGQLDYWLGYYDSDCKAVANVRCSKTLLAVCIGEEPLWNSNDNTSEQLTFDFVMQKWEQIIRERLEPIKKWKGVTLNGLL